MSRRGPRVAWRNLRPSRTVVSRRRVAPRAAYALMACVIGLALFASGTPSPLYAEGAEM